MKLDTENNSIILVHVGGVKTLDQEIAEAFKSGSLNENESAFAWENAGEYADMTDAERLERFLQGDPNLGMHTSSHIPVGKINSALYPFIENDRDRSQINPTYEAETSVRATFFYYAESIIDLKECVDALLIQPTSEAGEARIQAAANDERDEFGRLITRESGDAYGDNKTTITFFEVPKDKFDALCQSGMAFTGHGRYVTPKGEECLTSECCLSDRALGEIRDHVIIHGSLPTILKDKNIFGYAAGYEGDRYNTEASHYTPLFTKMPKKQQQHYTASSDDQLETYSWLNEMIAERKKALAENREPLYSEEDIEMARAACRSAMDYYSSKNTDLSDLDDEDEMGEDDL